ncbi:acyl-CoA N-acyltransferases superfamily protein [Tanacetum coccineum]|uniref:Acyl-CoA N-acyltransferases superfamily protein n=1 Tax=Tanacetum coccineum TaxID=301880 RepID=A0ABQ5DTT0_9ASTR
MEFVLLVLEHEQWEKPSNAFYYSTKFYFGVLHFSRGSSSLKFIVDVDFKVSRFPVCFSQSQESKNARSFKVLAKSLVFNLNGHLRFPNTITPDGHVELVDVSKLKRAVLHSSVVVSVFAKTENEWYNRMVPLNAFSGELVGFGRAVCDGSLTASIYDVMVIPSLRGRGIGRMILQRIIRLLTNKGIYDIAALCSDQEMDFFKACGFGDDMLGSTTMMYTRSGNDTVISAGRKLLMVPPLRKL